MRFSTDRYARAGTPIGYEPERDIWRDVRYSRRFVAYFWFQGWDVMNLGVRIALAHPNLELHVPCGFFRIGWMYGPWR